MSVWNSNFWNLFDARYKKATWIVLIVLIQVVIALTVPRLFLKGPKTRSTFMSLGMGAKSLIFIAYEVSTEYFHKLQRWRSYKANTILNGLDIAFWGAVAFLNLQANITSCSGVSCYLGWAIVGIALVVNQVYIFAFIMCWREWKGLTGSHRSLHQEEALGKLSSNSSSIPMQTTKTTFE
ncbi:uncharacterized protein RCC_11384 [Ramularia collo-cygni]|uniref:MARVEL domain-containing protein n=1 Tax=Ramularia collo-cygni TaxID=112498 RepID=A0A2D3VEQ9_9PEZI|nr:uncharacterized protein RCC_11384 [Ramularia collo-cygni]CZT25715.1 uncharacterized protein RCC_11384 [Ramularia collo-cygni]